MKKNGKRLKLSGGKVGTNLQKYNMFFRENIYAIAVGLLVLNMLTFYSNSVFKSEAMELIERHGKLLKENLGKVHFLTATGQHIVGEKAAVTYADPKFKQYIANTLSDSLLQGSSSLSKGFTLNFNNPNEISRKNKRYGEFKQFFTSRRSVLVNYEKGLYSLILENKYPEFISFIEVETKSFNTSRRGNENYYKFGGSVSAKLLIKSWITEIKKWDTRKVQVTIPFEGMISVEKYAGNANPFGLNFTKITVPIVSKPSAKTVLAKMRKR